MRTEQLYRRMLEENPNTSINIALAASMVYAARHGVCEPEHRGDEWSAIARDLKARYGECLDADQAGAEMNREGPLSLSDLADMFGLRHDSLRRACIDGRLPARKVGAKGFWMTTRAELQRALDEGRISREPGRPRRIVD